MPNTKGKVVGNIDSPNEYSVYSANVGVDGILKKAKITFFFERLDTITSN